MFFLLRGLLSIAWSQADPELLLSSAKDNRILCWNPNTGEVPAFLLCSKGLIASCGVYGLHHKAPAIFPCPGLLQMPLLSRWSVSTMSWWSNLSPHLSRWYMNYQPPTSGALTSSGVPGTQRCCRLQPSTVTSASTPSWGAAARLSARHRQTRWVNSFTYEHCWGWKLASMLVV